ncbi:MAG: Gfo/Idh/MocA family oxidoreductase, partial [Deltaproteobacteria bacterium]|nr:Gfo/Idh/MocA family oxidoreductase [Deltaproteobacteria bacterium]
MVNIAVVGCGRWGLNYVRVFEELNASRVDWVFDRDELCLKRVVQRFPTVKAARTLSEVLNCRDDEAVVVASAASDHYETVMKCLMAGKHVRVEKPIALSIEEAEEMISLADSKKKTLMVGHTFLFNSGIR